LYACESWTPTADIEKRIQATVMKCVRKLLGILYKEHVTNEVVRDKIRQAIGSYKELLDIVKRQKLRWYGHVMRLEGRGKTILQGPVQGRRRRGRQRKRWEDNIKEWTGLKLCNAMRKAENKEEWTEMVANSSVVPLWSTRLRE